MPFRSSLFNSVFYVQMEKACQSIFTDASEDSELRILAFKVYAMYPSNNKAAVIKSVLDDKNCQLQSMNKNKNVLSIWPDIAFNC